MSQFLQWAGGVGTDVWARPPGKGLHAQQGLSVLPFPCPLGGPWRPRAPSRAFSFHAGPPPLTEQWVPPWFSRWEAVGKAEGCLSVSPGKPKALLARCLEPASWGQRSPSEASWHPGAMAAEEVGGPPLGRHCAGQPGLALRTSALQLPPPGSQ